MKKMLAMFLAVLFVVCMVPVNAFAEGTVACNRCGQQVPDYSNFCLYCGCPLRPTSDPTMTIETAEGKAELIGLARVPEGFFSDQSINLDDYVLVLVQFTNYLNEEKQFQNMFRVTGYQNGVELDSKIGGYRQGVCPEADNFFKNVVQNGMITIGRIFKLSDASDVTVVLNNNGMGTGTPAQATLALASRDGGAQVVGGSSPAEPAAAPAGDVKAEVEAALQGVWMLGAENSFTFQNGSVTISSGGNILNGTYTVGDSTVDASLQASNGTVAIHLPYTWANGVLTLSNNQNQQLTKQ